MHLAVGTSFAIIVPTSIASVLTHHKFNAVDVDIVKNYGIHVIIGVIFGAIFAASLDTKSLILFFSINKNIYKYIPRSKEVYKFILFHIDNNTNKLQWFC